MSDLHFPKWTYLRLCSFGAYLQGGTLPVTFDGSPHKKFQEILTEQQKKPFF